MEGRQQDKAAWLKSIVQNSLHPEIYKAVYPHSVPNCLITGPTGLIGVCDCRTRSQFPSHGSWSCPPSCGSAKDGRCANVKMVCEALTAP